MKDKIYVWCNMKITVIYLWMNDGQNMKITIIYLWKDEGP